MGRKALFDKVAIDKLLSAQCDVIARRQLTQRSMTNSAIQRRTSPGGAWQVLLPGIYLNSSQRPTHEQQDIAAVLYAGPGCAVTGLAALIAHGVPGPRDAERIIDVLVPATRQRANHSFVRLHRTDRMPATIYPVGMVQYVPVGRAIADFARLDRRLPEVRDVVARAIQGGRVRVAELTAEVAKGPMPRSATLRVVLAEVADGVRSAAEADLRVLIKGSRLPEPLYNASLYLGGKFLARPDVWWPHAGVAVEVDSREWHLRPRDWERTMARHSRMSACGIIVLHYPPSRIRREPDLVLSEMLSAVARGDASRLPSDLRTVPASS